MRVAFPSKILNASCPINWNWPGNAGLVGEWAVTPIPGWRGGNTLRDLARGAKTPHNGTLGSSSVAAWSSIAGRPALKCIASSGTNNIIASNSSFNQNFSQFTVLFFGQCGPTNVFDPKPQFELQFRWNLALLPNSTATWDSSVGSVTSSAGSAPFGSPVIAVGVLDASNVTLYLAGKQVAQTPKTGSYSQSNQILDFNCDNGYGFFIAGMLWNRPLSSSEIAAVTDQVLRGNPNRWNWLSRTAWVVSPGGGTTYSRSIADNLAGNDVTQRLVSSFRTLADYPALIDVLSKQTSSYRSLSDSLGLYSTVIQNITYNRIASDNLGVHDTLSSLVSSLRYLADNLAIDDTSERIVDSLRNVADSLALYDSTSRKGVSNRIINDNLGFSDTFSRLVASYRFLSDSLALYDTLSTQQIHPGVLVLKIIDNLGVNDTLSRQVRLFRLLSDYLGENDTLTLKTSSKRVVNDNLGINDSLIRSQVFVRLLQDYLGESDKSQRIILSLRKLTDNLTLFDSVTASIGLGLRILIQDNIGFNDFLSRVATGLRYIADFLAVNDSILRQATNLRTLADNLGSNDQTSRLVNAYRTLTDNLGLSDSLIAELIPYVIVTRIISLTGSLTNRNLTGSSPSRNLTGD